MPEMPRMTRSPYAFALTCVLAALAASFLAEQRLGAAEAEPAFDAAQDWPWWRGPARNGIGSADQQPPLRWSDTENVLWKSPIPGRGHGSPIVVGDQVFLATADHESESQSVLCFRRQTGEKLWQAEVHRGGFEKKGNAKSSLASSTPACDGRQSSSISCTTGRSIRPLSAAKARYSGKPRSRTTYCTRASARPRPSIDRWSSFRQITKGPA